jgi:ribosomal protein S18 acetylase RimI-like enzyme
MESATAPPDEVTIRAYAPCDWPAVCRIHDAARPQELAAGGVDPRAFRTMEAAAEEDEFFVSETLVARLGGGTVVGFVSWNGAYLTWLYIEPAYQRRGIGRRLLAEALVRIGPEAWTTLIDGNEPARSLYRAVGMDVVSTKAGHIEGFPASGLRMALPTSRMSDPAARRLAATPPPPG